MGSWSMAEAQWHHTVLIKITTTYLLGACGDYCIYTDLEGQSDRNGLY